ncbi:MAG TPA: hypothetical protein VLG10_18410 [Methylomirabilota bacterium]|nr:hypothetical protein [Methylomirabilota bacterium]
MPVALLGLVLVSVPGQSAADGRGFVSGGGAKSHGGGFRSGHAHFRGVKSTHTFASRSSHPATSVFPTTVDPWKFWGKNFHHGFHKHKQAFVTSGVVFGGGTIVYGYAPPVVYAPEPVVYSSPPAVYAAPAPMPTVVEYPTGRYELRGDGITYAYQWVWIPKPPPPPPPEAAPDPAPESRPPARGERSIGKIYRWTDDEGVTTLTDRLENVPERYRPRAEPKA